MGGCVIYLDNIAYSAGDTLRGKLVCTFNSIKKLRGIVVNLRGNERTTWYKNEVDTSSSTQTRSVKYIGENVILALQMTLSGPVKISPGVYNYPFDLVLPDILPDTFKNSHGHIEYCMTAIVIIKGKTDYEAKQYVIIKSPVDFNKIPNLPMIPVRFEDSDTICDWCCDSGSISMHVYLDKLAFVLSERLKMKVNIMNMSKRNTSGLSVQIFMTVTSKVTSPKKQSKTEQVLITSANGTGVGARRERTYDIALDLPRNIILPNFRLSKLFEKCLTLVVRTDMPRCHDDLEIRAGIILGHLPLNDTILLDGTYQRIDSTHQRHRGDPPSYYQPNNLPTEPATLCAPPSYDALSEH